MAHAKAYPRPPTPAYEPVWTMRQATESDCHYLSSRLHRGCLDEIEAVSKYAPLTVLLQGHKLARVVVDSARDTQPVAYIGARTQENESSAYIWLAFTDRIITSSTYWSFAEYTRGIVEAMNNMFPLLQSLTDARNIRKTDWLEYVGFKHSGDIPQFGRKELPFKQYERMKPTLHV